MRPPIIVVLLGSYDPETKRVLDQIKRSLQNYFSGMNIYFFLLEDLELYRFRTSEDQNFTLLVERFSEGRVSAFIFRLLNLLTVYDLSIERDLKEELYEFVKKHYKAVTIVEVPILEKLRAIAEYALVILLIRHKEETRGGELIELAYLANEFGEKIWFIKKENVKLSSMVLEILDHFEIKMRCYSTDKELTDEVIRIVSHRLQIIGKRS
ncbi:MAG: hypothetical protein Q6351_007680 [Candidatus Njordarchaeum guaymaensis]